MSNDLFEEIRSIAKRENTLSLQAISEGRHKCITAFYLKDGQWWNDDISALVHSPIETLDRAADLIDSERLRHLVDHFRNHPAGGMGAHITLQAHNLTPAIIVGRHIEQMTYELDADAMIETFQSTSVVVARNLFETGEIDDDLYEQNRDTRSCAALYATPDRCGAHFLEYRENDDGTVDVSGEFEADTEKGHDLAMFREAFGGPVVDAETKRGWDNVSKHDFEDAHSANFH